jgi:hypothetical protein
VPLSRAKIALGVPLGLAVSEVTSFWLRRAHPHPLGLTVAGPTMPRMLGTHGWGGGLNYMSVVYGYPHQRDVSRPLIEVMTCFSADRCYLPSLKEALTRAEHRDAAWARGEWEDPTDPFSPAPRMPVPASGFAHQDRAVVIDGEQRVIPAVSFRHYEALRFRQGTKVVTAVARFGFPDAPLFHAVDDLGPYVAGFRRFMLGQLRLREA